MTTATLTPARTRYSVKAVPELEVRDMSHNEYLTRLSKLCGAIDDPTFIEPPEIPPEYGAPLEITV